MIEDLHWADDATLDLVALLGRRLVRSPGCLILTSRSEALSPRSGACSARAARVRAADRAGAAVGGRRRACWPARPGARRPICTRVSGGNPFFVTEALAAPTGDGPRQRARRGRVPRRRARRRRARGRRAVRGRARARPSWSWSTSGAAPRRSTRASRPASCACAARRSRSATTSPGARSRRASRPSAGASSTGWCCARSRRAGTPDLARLVHHARRAGDADAIRRLAPAGGAGRERGGRAPAGARALGGGAAGRRRERPGGAAGRLDRGVSVRAARARRRGGRALLALHEAGGDALRAGDDAALAVAASCGGRARAGGGRGRGPRDRGAGGVPRQPRAGDGAERALAAGDAVRATRRRRSSSGCAP